MAEKAITATRRACRDAARAPIHGLRHLIKQDSRPKTRAESSRNIHLPAPESNRRMIRLDVAGDRILFGKFSGAEIKMDNREYLIPREEEVLGIIEGKAAAAGGKK